MVLQELSINRSTRFMSKEQMAHGPTKTLPGLSCKFKAIPCSIACTGIHQRRNNINGNILTPSSPRELKVSGFTNRMLVWLKKEEKLVLIESLQNIYYQGLKKQDIT